MSTDRDSSRLIVVGVMGGSSADSDHLKAAERIGAFIAKRGWTLLCGGRTGVMEAASKGAWDNDGLTVGILPGHRREDANPYIRLPIVTGIGEARNVINVLSSQIVVAIGGGGGTLSEIALAVKNGVSVLGYRTCEFRFSDGQSSPLFIPCSDVESICNELDRRLCGN